MTSVDHTHVYMYIYALYKTNWISQENSSQDYKCIYYYNYI